MLSEAKAFANANAEANAETNANTNANANCIPTSNPDYSDFHQKQPPQFKCMLKLLLK